MYLEEYRKARQTGMKEAKRSQSRGCSPYLPVLDVESIIYIGESGRILILQTARIYSGVSGKALGWRSAVGLRCKFNRCAV